MIMKDNDRMGSAQPPADSPPLKIPVIDSDTFQAIGSHRNHSSLSSSSSSSSLSQSLSSAQDSESEHVYSVQYVERRRRTCQCAPRRCQKRLGSPNSRNDPSDPCSTCTGHQSHDGTSRQLLLFQDSCYSISQSSPMPSSSPFPSPLPRTPSLALPLAHTTIPSPFMMMCLFLLSLVKRLVKSTSRFVFYVTSSQKTFPVVALLHQNSVTTHESARISSSVTRSNSPSHVKLSSSAHNEGIYVNSKQSNGSVSSTPASRGSHQYQESPPAPPHGRQLKARSIGSAANEGQSSRAHLIDGAAKQLRTILCTLLVLFPFTISAYELKPTTTITKVTLAGEKAQLPCELPLPADRPTLILWYKDQSTKPFYSYDARETASGRHKIHDNSDLATRSRFTLEKLHQNSVKVATRLGFLEVEGIILADAGNYTCRVDFMTSQTMMALLQLTVHEEIRGLEVFDAYGTMVSKVVGPYQQSTRVILSCRAYGGYPAPVVQWMSGDMILKSSNDPGFAGTESTLSGGGGGPQLGAHHPLPTVNVMLHLSGLKREDNGREIKCVAFNTNLTQPRSRLLTLQVYLPPLEVKVEGLEKPLQAGIESMLLCRATGSRPPATLTWRLEGSSGLTPLPAQSSLDQNTTLRRGRLLPTPDDNGRTLTCTASNPKVADYKLEDSHKLEVYFAPEVEAKLAPALDPDNIKEGEDVYFECLIRANPPESRVNWLHEGKQLHTDRQLGILAQGHNLVLQKVSRHARGKYQCRVTNAIDTVTSGATALNVMFAPECSGSRNVTVSVTPTEEVKLNCVVESNPNEVNFVWKVNTSRGVKELDHSSYTSQGRTSTLVYKPSAHAIANEQYGVVFCQGINRLGIQKIPCMFVISPAGPPEELQSCVLRNQSATSLAVVCIPGHDGGLEQHFIALIKDAENGEVVANITSKEPQFSVGRLAPGRDYLVMVKAANSKGASEPYVLEGFALKVDEIKINNSNSEESSPLLAVFVGVLIGFGLIFTLLAVANKARGRRRRERAAEATPENKLSTTEDITPASPSTNDSLDVVGEGGVEPKVTDVVPTVKTPEPRGGSMVTSEPPQPQTLGSPGSLGTRSYLPGPAGHTGSLPRSQLQSRPQPLHSVDLPHITSSNHKYYTLKINCTRQNNESFV